jgi:endonuclease YncB( thermonuclease family)
VARRFAPAAAVAIATVAVLLCPAAPASAATIAGDPAYTDVPVQETGRITKVLDGDTFEFLADGAARATRVRLLGVNTPEVTGQDNIHFAEDMCAGREAEAQLERLLPAGTRVELRSLHKESTNRGRILRYVFAYDPQTGKYDTDISAIVAESGLAMWFTVDQESALSYPYRLIVQQAQRGGRGIWDPNHCGPVEQPDARLAVTVSWDAPGTDQSNLNGEFVVVRNVGASAVDLSGWLLRDSSLTSWYYFPGGTVLPAGDFRIVHVGSGTPGSPTGRDLYMGATEPLFPNTQDGKFLGDGAYLLDRSTAVRFYDEYPCIANCRDPLQGAVTLAKVQPVSLSRVASRAANEEYIVIRNTSAAPVLLDGYYLRRKVSTYPFPPGTQILPGRTLTVRIGKGAPTALVQYWGRPAPLLTNAHDRVELLSNKNVVISRKQW